MSRTLTHTVTFEIADGSEHEVRIRFVYHPRIRASGPTYDSGGAPGEPAFCEFVRALLKSPRGAWLDLPPDAGLSIWAEAYFDAHPDEFIEAATDAIESDRDEWEDRKRDEQREDRLTGFGA